MSLITASKTKPDIRVITRLVPPSGNLVQGQSELPIPSALAESAARHIAANHNHYAPAEGVSALREALAAKIAAINHVTVDTAAQPLELLITHGGTGALVAIGHIYLKGYSCLLFEPYYPFHRRITEDLGGKAESMPLEGPTLTTDPDRLRARVRELKNRSSFPLRAIVVCSPANPTGKVFSSEELQLVADVCHEFDLLCISDEVYENYVIGQREHISMATLPGMFERTITVNSFSKSWNVSGWRVGYIFGAGKIVAPLNAVTNVFYVNVATPLQHALADVLPNGAAHYQGLHDDFTRKRDWISTELTDLGFSVYDSGSAFYLWAKIPKQFKDAQPFNQMLMEKHGVAAVPGAAFADTDDWDNYMRLCIAREDEKLQTCMERLRQALRT
jgi:aminotransferase